MRVVGVIYSRYDSSRLRGKAVADINGITLLERVIDRAYTSTECSELVLATTNRVIDKPLRQIAQNKNLKVVVGPLDDLIQRTKMVVDKTQADAIVRICGDRPFLSGSLIDEAVRKHKATESDLTSTNIGTCRVPPGITTEVLSSRAIDILINSSEASREHLTEYCYLNQDKFILNALSVSGADFTADMRFVVDTPRDLEVSIRLAEILDGCGHIVEEAWLGSLCNAWHRIRNQTVASQN